MTTRPKPKPKPVPERFLRLKTTSSSSSSSSSSSTPSPPESTITDEDREYLKMVEEVTTGMDVEGLSDEEIREQVKDKVMDKMIDKAIEKTIKKMKIESHKKKGEKVKEERMERRKEDKEIDDLSHEMKKLFVTESTLQSRIDKLDQFFQSRTDESTPEEITKIVEYFSHLTESKSDAHILLPPSDQQKFEKALRLQRKGYTKEVQFKESKDRN